MKSPSAKVDNAMEKGWDKQDISITKGNLDKDKLEQPEAKSKNDNQWNKNIKMKNFCLQGTELWSNYWCMATK